jgi:hypothetical protein
MYSQHDEDDIIAGLFAGQEPGNLIDVGAYVAKDLSNSRLLIERGWDATLIEFAPMAVKNLVSEYSGCADRVRVVAAAMTPSPQHVMPFQVTDDALSSNDDSHARKWKDYGAGYYGTLWVPTLTVRQLIDQFYGDKPLHFVNVDTEGSSVELAIEFMMLDGSWKPPVICVEHDDRDSFLMAAAQRSGYRLEWRNECNAILVTR